MEYLYRGNWQVLHSKDFFILKSSLLLINQHMTGKEKVCIDYWLLGPAAVAGM